MTRAAWLSLKGADMVLSGSETDRGSGALVSGALFAQSAGDAICGPVLTVHEQYRLLMEIQELDICLSPIQRVKEATPEKSRQLKGGLARVQAQIADKDSDLRTNHRIERNRIRCALEDCKERILAGQDRLKRGVPQIRLFRRLTNELDCLRETEQHLEGEQRGVDDLIVRTRQEIDRLKVVSGAWQAELQPRTPNATDDRPCNGKDLNLMKLSRSEKALLIDPGLLKRYERVRDSRGGIGVSFASSGRCMGCNMIIPAQQYNQILRSPSDQSCASCLRLLVADHGENRA